MKVFSSYNYDLLRYQVSPDGCLSGWVLRRKNCSSSRGVWSPETVIMREAKWIHDNKVYFLKPNGIVEDNSRKVVATYPCYAVAVD